MNSQLVASICCKVRGWFACRRNRSIRTKQRSFEVKKGLSSTLGMLLMGLFITCLTIRTTAQTDCQITCDDQKNISIGTDGFAIIFPELVINGDFDCALPVTVDVLDETGTSIGNRVGCEEVGQSLTVKVSGANNISCWSTIKIEDKLATVIRCNDLFLPCTSPTHPDSIGYPALQDNCGSTSQEDLNYFDLFTELPCGTVIEGREVNARVTRSWTIIDQYDNVGFCTQNIYLLKGAINNVVFPGNCDGIDRPTLNCATDPDNLSITGAPTVNGQPLETAGFCKFFVDYKDQTVDICPPASYRILRRWEIIDLCTKEVNVHIQDIILADNTGPDLVCPDSFSINANSVNCTASIILPQAVAYDSCSNVVVQPTWEFGAGYGPFTNVPSGNHIITYTATDECGNTTECTTTLTVIDNTKPVAVCRDQVNIALANDGIATVAATVFDGGSKDNCSLTKIEARKDSIFEEFLTFDCNYLGETHEITLRVTDEAGYTNECRSELIINDEKLPIVACPPNITINCQLDFEDVSLTGEPTATDDCAIAEVYFFDDQQFNACGTSGTLRRNWFADDLSGNIGTCTQIIRVIDETPLDIVFPAEYTTHECGADLSPDITGRPVISGNDCEDILVSHEDRMVELGGNSCFQILRTWNVIDWCEFNGTDNTNGGLITFTQIINVLDWDSPEITFCPEDITVDIATFDCETRVDLPLIIANDCNDLLIFNNDSPFAERDNEDASGIYPFGTTTVTYTVSDGCNNTSTCQVNITVNDGHAPTPVCKHSISIALRADGTVIVPQTAINSGSYDNCGTAENLTYEITPDFFTCEDIGQQTINLVVTDEFGNSDFCTTDIFIQDNRGICDPNGLSAITGKVINEDGEAMESIAVEISGGMTETTTTNIAGEYLFENLSKSESYTVQPMTGKDAKAGISTFDIVLIQKHILGSERLDSPYKMIAADINNSGSITAFDVVQLRQLILGIHDSFPNNSAWRYVLSDYNFIDDTNPLLETFPESINYNLLLGSKQEKDFIAIKVGDVNNSVSPTAMAGTSRNQLSPLQLTVSDVAFQANETYRIPIRAKHLKDIIAYQFTLQFDTDLLTIEAVEPNEANDIGRNHFGLNHKNKGLLTTSWENISQAVYPENSPLFTLLIKTKQAFQLQEALSINSAITTSEAYNIAGEVLPIELIIEKEIAELYQNQPNPFQHTTRIGFKLPQATTGTLSIHDIHGRLLKQYNGDYNAGYNEVLIDINGLNSNGGVLYYQLDTPITERLSKKMLLIK